MATAVRSNKSVFTAATAADQKASLSGLIAAGTVDRGNTVTVTLADAGGRYSVTSGALQNAGGAI